MNKKKALALALTLALTLSACGTSKSDTPSADGGDTGAYKGFLY